METTSPTYRRSGIKRSDDTCEALWIFLVSKSLCVSLWYTLIQSHLLLNDFLSRTNNICGTYQTNNSSSRGLSPTNPWQSAVKSTFFFPLLSRNAEGSVLHFCYRIKQIFLQLLNGGRGATVGRPWRPRVPFWSFPCTTCDWPREEEGGKSLIKQIISCWGREQLHFSRAPSLNPGRSPGWTDWWSFIAQFPLHR